MARSSWTQPHPDDWTSPPRYSRHHAPWPRGVTFIEFITLTIVILILASIGVPRISPIVQNFQLKGAAWQLGGDLRLARQRAVTLQKRFRVCLASCAITVPGGSYSVEQDVGTPSIPKWASETGAPVGLPPGVTIAAGKATAVTFTAGGMASGATFTLTNLMGTYQVAVDSTGRVRACQGTCPP